MSNNTRNYYEGMFVTKGGGGEDAWEQSRSAVKGVLEDHEATIDYVENWADQQFEKEIKKQRRGKYVLTYFQADPSEINEIKQDTQMNERILRVLILNREKETTYRDMIQERIEANKEEEEEEEEEKEEEGEEELEDETEKAEGEDQAETEEEEEEEGEVEETVDQVPDEETAEGEVDADEGVEEETETAPKEDEEADEEPAEDVTTSETKAEQV